MGFACNITAAISVLTALSTQMILEENASGEV